MGTRFSITTIKSTKIQILRGLAIVAVVFIHTTPGGLTQVICRPFLHFAVGMFLFLSGLLSDAHSWKPLKRLVKAMTRVVMGKASPTPVRAMEPLRGICPIKILSTTLYNIWTIWAIMTGTACLTTIFQTVPSEKSPRTDFSVLLNFSTLMTAQRSHLLIRYFTLV